uniref:Reverse transcriptase zinc-binding domain-containing protein n=1 Tax=Tanacetum cinerariifolium TaxID=118510 RepID=A0A6L2JT09_TANCI|nr:hypothetical protein [Tanacetum cinerariifolium]
MVVDIVVDGNWTWPTEWLNEFSILRQIKTPDLNTEKKDWLVWIHKDEKECEFSTKEVYKNMRNQSSEITWTKLFKSNADKWNDIIEELAEKPNNNSIWSIVRRLCLVGAVYAIWREETTGYLEMNSIAGKSP